MDFIPGLIIEFLGDLVLQLLFELGFRSLAEPFTKPSERKTPLAILGFLIYGSSAGLLSLVFVPTHITPNIKIRSVNLIITPVLAGFAMSLFGSLRQKRNLQLAVFDRFSFGYSFALAMAIVRFFGAK